MRQLVCKAKDALRTGPEKLAGYRLVQSTRRLREDRMYVFRLFGQFYFFQAPSACSPTTHWQ